MDERRRGAGYGGRVRRLVEERAVPRGMRLGPLLELNGEREATVWRHDGLLEYGDSRVLVLAAGGRMYEIEGAGLVITAMSRDMVSVRGQVHGVRILGGPAEGRP